MPEFPVLPAISDQPLTLILLARNQESVIQQMVQGWVDLLNDRNRGYEILVVDDGSSDRTAELVQGMLSEEVPLRLLQHEQPQGLGAALRTGLGAATMPLVAHAPCDPAYPPALLKLLFAQIDRVHLVSGFRAGRRIPWFWRGMGWVYRLLLTILLGHGPEKSPGWLGLRGWLAASLARAFFGVRFRDVDCPFRLMRREILTRVPIQSDGPFALVEMVAKVNFLGGLFGEEVPLPVPAQSNCLSAPFLGPTLREASRVLARPDFGPAQIDSPTLSLAINEESVNPKEDAGLLPPANPV